MILKRDQKQTFVGPKGLCAITTTWQKGRLFKCKLTPPRTHINKVNVSFLLTLL